MSNGQELIKILSIDGGGVRGIIPSMVLAEIENKTGKRIAEMFDLMAGTSAGGIITLGLNVKGQNGKPKFSAKEISKFFTDDCPEVFKKSPWKKFTSGFGLLDEKYDHEPLVTVLKKYMGETKLKSCKTKTLISTYDILNRHPQFFKSWSPSYENHKMREIARATSAAPTYFEPMELKMKHNNAVLVDGGVFINNPAVSAYAEAIRLIKEGKLPKKPILIISLGTGELTRKITYKEAKDWGLIQWVRPVLDVVFDGVSDAVDYQLNLILGKGKFYRFQTKLVEGFDDFDDASNTNIKTLIRLAEALITRRQADINKICQIIK